MSGHGFLEHKLEEDRLAPVDEDEWRARQDEYARETSGAGILEGARAADAFLNPGRYSLPLTCEVCLKPSQLGARCRTCVD